MTEVALSSMKNGRKKTASSAFWALDSRLPRAAAQAAVEFDWILQARRGNRVPQQTLESIKDLSELISESVQTIKPSGEIKALVDSAGLSLLARAYNASNRNHPLKNREELASAIVQLTDSLNKAGEEGESDEDVLERMKEFCIALSTYASAYRKMVYGNRPEHPYRK